MIHTNDTKTTPRVGALTTEIGECFFMFSYFSGGIMSLVPDKHIDFSSLVKMIRFNPMKDKIEKIRYLRITGGKDSYKEEKRMCPYITPNCIVRYRELKGILYNDNLMLFSSYIYYDIDLEDITKVDEFKDYFIEKYGHLVSLVCKSISGGGITIFVKSDVPITSKKEFNDVWRWIRENIFGDEDIDESNKDIGRAMFVSYDPDVYVDYENELSIPVDYLDGNDYDEKGDSEDFCSPNDENESFFTIIPIEKVRKKIRLRTQVEVEHPVVDFNPIPFVEISYPSKIKDGKKHKIYTLLIHRLVHLNPFLPPNYIFSYINYLNDTVAEDPKMSYSELKFVFSTNYQIIQSENYLFKNDNIKQFHFNLLFKGNKSKIINEINGKIRTNKTIEKIQDAKDIIIKQGRKPTQKEVARLIGKSMKTVQTHYHSQKLDLNDLIRNINEFHQYDLSDLSSGSDPVFKNRQWGSKKDSINKERFVHPECPEWVLQWEKEKDRI